MLDSIENFMNWLSDMDWGWWPFLFLRPDTNEDMTTLLIAKITLFYAFPIGVILSIVFGEWWPVLFSVVFFFIFYRLTFAVFWNRRARRLRSLVDMESA